MLPALLRTQDRASAFLAAVPAALAATGDAIHPVDLLLWVGMHPEVLPGDSGALSPALTRVMNVCRLASLAAGVPAPGQAPARDPSERDRDRRL